MQELITTLEALEIQWTKYNAKKGGIRRHALLPASTFKKGDTEIEVTKEILEEMAANMRGGGMGKKRMVTMAHPAQGEDLDSAPAVGWMLCDTAEVSSFGDGGYALYVNIKWLPEMAKAIESEEYQYISPVFTNRWKNEAGEDKGWAMLFAGVTNNPHWTTQPGLWQEFAASLDAASDNDGAVAPKQTMEGNMGELEKKVAELTAQVVKLETQLDSKASEVVELTANSDTAKAEVIELTNRAEEAEKQASEAMAKIEAMEAEARKAHGDALIAKYTADKDNPAGVLLEKHIKDDEGNQTRLAKAAYEDEALFLEMVALVSKPVVNSDPKGGERDGTEPAGADQRAQAHKMAVEFCNANQDASFEEAFIAAKKAVSEGIAELKL